MVLISLNIEEKQKILAKKLGLTHAGIYMRGLQAASDPDPHAYYGEKIKEYEIKVKRLANLLDHYVVKSCHLEDRVKELEGKLNVLEKKRKRNQ